MNEVCIANIGPSQRRVRLYSGLVGLGAAAVIAAAPYLLGVDPLLRYASLPFVFGGVLGVLQHRERT
jgi:hypothetical protein